MSSNIHTKYPIYDETRWILHIKTTLEKELEKNCNFICDIPISIFNVPKTLLSTDPNSYIPQQVAIGPYHYSCPEFHEMERHKMKATQRIIENQNVYQNNKLKLENFVREMFKLSPNIRASYHKFLDFSDEALAWMMVIDSSFLIEFLRVYALREASFEAGFGGVIFDKDVALFASCFDDASGRKSIHNVVLRDVVMLENQIPLFVLRKMLEIQSSSLESADVTLSLMLKGVCKEESPFKTISTTQNINTSQIHHLLDYLYHTLIPKQQEPSPIIDNNDICIEIPETEDSPIQNPNYVKQLLIQITKILLLVKRGRIVKFVTKPLKVFRKLPWDELNSISGYLMKSASKTEILTHNDCYVINKPPSVEEITIPSVTQLWKSGVIFVPTKGDISTVHFDTKKVIFYLPVITLDVNTEVVMRNLVAYEASNATLGPLVFTRYIELMNGIIDDKNDVKILRESGVIVNYMRSDFEAAKMWNGMSKSIRLTKVELLDKVIEDVNKYYEGLWKVRIGNCLKGYMFGSWQVLTFFASILLLFLMLLETICSVYHCSDIFS